MTTNRAASDASDGTVEAVDDEAAAAGLVLFWTLLSLISAWCLPDWSRFPDRT